MATSSAPAQPGLKHIANLSETATRGDESMALHTPGAGKPRVAGVRTPQRFCLSNLSQRSIYLSRRTNAHIIALPPGEAVHSPQFIRHGRSRFTQSVPPATEHTSKRTSALRAAVVRGGNFGAANECRDTASRAPLAVDRGPSKPSIHFTRREAPVAGDRNRSVGRL